MRKQLQRLREISQYDNVWIGIIPFTPAFIEVFAFPSWFLSSVNQKTRQSSISKYPKKEEIIREDVPVIDNGTGTGPTPPTYLEIFAELQQLTSPEKTTTILESALADLDIEVRSNEGETG